MNSLKYRSYPAGLTLALTIVLLMIIFGISSAQLSDQEIGSMQARAERGLDI
jgi:hypothetical protein